MKKPYFLIQTMFIAMICGAMLAGCGGSGSNNNGNTATEATASTPLSSKPAEDKLIDDFETFIDDYIANLKAAIAGERLAALNAERQVGEYEQWELRFEQAQLTAEQELRLEEIMGKLAAASR